MSANPASSTSQAIPSTLATSNVVVVVIVIVVIIFRDRKTGCGVVVAFEREGGSLNKVTANLEIYLL